MKEIIEKLIELEKRTSSERGEYDLFALFLREESANKWDILVSAPWIHNNKEEALKYLATNIQRILTKEDLLLISRIVIIDEKDPSLLALQGIRTEHGSTELRETNFFGLRIKHAFVITSKKSRAA